MQRKSVHYLKSKEKAIVNSHWVKHKGKRVFIADFSGFGTDTHALKKEADMVARTISREPDGSVISISKVEGTAASKENVQILMSVLSHSKKAVAKRCVVGVSGVRWTFFDAFNRLAGRAQFNSFNTLEEALDWIVQDDNP
jgi:hypothetical protein